MSLLSKLLRKEAEPAAVIEHTPCLHISAVPQWDAAADIGKEALATRFVCAVCSESFTPDVYRQLRATEADRVHQVLDR